MVKVLNDAKRIIRKMQHIKRIIVLFFFLALIIITVVSALENSVTSSHISNRLTTQKTEEENKTRTDFIDEKGKITYATDRQYATVIKYYRDGKTVRE